MFATRTSLELNRRREELVALSDAQREELCAECKRLRPLWGPVETGSLWARQVWPYLAAVLPVLGSFGARAEGKSRGLLGRLGRMAGWVASIRSLWSVRR
jgi:hypothetical protein